MKGIIHCDDPFREAEAARFHLLELLKAHNFEDINDYVAFMIEARGLYGKLKDYYAQCEKWTNLDDEI